MAGAALVVDRETPCPGPLETAEEELPTQEVAPGNVTRNRGYGGIIRR